MSDRSWTADNPRPRPPRHAYAEFGLSSSKDPANLSVLVDPVAPASVTYQHVVDGFRISVSLTVEPLA